MRDHTVKTFPFKFSGEGHNHGWMCPRCAKPRPMLGSKKVRFKGAHVKVCATCAAEVNAA